MADCNGDNCTDKYNRVQHNNTSSEVRFHRYAGQMFNTTAVQKYKKTIINYKETYVQDQTMHTLYKK